MARATQAQAAARRRNAAKKWKIEADEFHPDARIAARYADQSARLASKRDLTIEIGRQEKRVETADGAFARRIESRKLADLRLRLREVETEIEEFEKEEKS